MPPPARFHLLRCQPSRTLLLAKSQRYTRRAYSTPKDPEAGVDKAIHGVGQDKTKKMGPNEGQAPHVSEEAAAMSKITGGSGPDLNQGTRVEDVVKGDKETQEHLPKVMQDELKKEKDSGKRSYSTMAFRSRPSNFRSFHSAATRRDTSTADTMSSSEQAFTDAMLSQLNRGQAGTLAQSNEEFFDDDEGEYEYEVDDDELAPMLAEDKRHIFELPKDRPPHLHKRYEDIVDQVTKLLMRDGKLSQAQRNMSTILSTLRTSPAPKPAAGARAGVQLLPNHPPLATLPLDPVTFLTLAIDSIAPLFRIRAQKGLAGGGAALQIPVPLTRRQRRRTAVMWILQSVDAKRRAGTTRPFAQRVADELTQILEGRSAVWEKRTGVHGLGVRSRANLAVVAKKMGGRR